MFLLAPETSYCSFRLGDFLFGVETSRVQEVLRGFSVTPVPLAPAWVSGLINLRGQVVTVLDLKGRLGLIRDAGASPLFCVILKDGEEWIGLPVDGIGDVLEPPSGSFEEVPSTLTGESRRLIRGAYKLKRSLLLTLNVEEALGTQNWQ
jgi:purine-binding chemotaxis protein CheW